MNSWLDHNGKEWALWESAFIRWDHGEDEINDELGFDWRMASCEEILSVIDDIPMELPDRIWACESHDIDTHAMVVDVKGKYMYSSAIDNLRQVLAIKR